MSINTLIIDIETLDVAPTATILSISAFAFDKYDLDSTKKNIFKSIEQFNQAKPKNNNDHYFYSNVNLLNQLIKYKRTISNKSILFWQEQPEEASSLLSFDTHDLKNVLKELSDFICQKVNTYPFHTVYFRGSDFDGTILENAYKSLGVDVPWKYYKKRDIRTYIDALTGSEEGTLKNNNPCFECIPHFSLHDAMKDAEYMCIVTKRLLDS